MIIRKYVNVVKSNLRKIQQLCKNILAYVTKQQVLKHPLAYLI